MNQPEQPPVFTRGPWVDITDLIFPGGPPRQEPTKAGTVTAITTNTPTITVSWP